MRSQKSINMFAMKCMTWQTEELPSDNNDFRRLHDTTLTGQRSSPAHYSCRRSDFQQPQSAAGQASEVPRDWQKHPVVCWRWGSTDPSQHFQTSCYIQQLQRIVPFSLMSYCKKNVNISISLIISWLLTGNYFDIYRTAWIFMSTNIAQMLVLGNHGGMRQRNKSHSATQCIHLPDPPTNSWWRQIGKKLNFQNTN